MNKMRSEAAVILLMTVLASPSLWALDDEYQLGRGLPISDSVTLGGYISAEYANGDREHVLTIDDVAVLLYGAINEDVSFLVELESVNFIRTDFLADTTDTNLPPAVERFYLDYKFSDSLAVRIGKQITPIGYWNLQPINVLRETTSNPIYSRNTFPKFLSGVDFYGYTPFDESLTYHLYLQGTEDLDDAYININVDRHWGFSLEKDFGDGFQMGGSLGRYRQTDLTQTSYYQVDAKWDAWPVTLQAEAIINDRDRPARPDERNRAAYLQGEYAFDAQQALIARVEYVDDDALATERVGILGYSYRPLFPVSLKIEYQWHTDAQDNKVLASFSVLF